MKVRTGQHAPGEPHDLAALRHAISNAERRENIRVVPDLSRGVKVPDSRTVHLDDWRAESGERHGDASSPCTARAESGDGWRNAESREGPFSPAAKGTSLAVPRSLPSDLQHGRNGASLRALPPAHRDPWFWVAVVVGWVLVAGVLVGMGMGAGS